MADNGSGRCSRLALLLAALLILLGMGLRVSWMQRSALWCDEAESAINALTILQTGLPGWKYLGLPVFENTLTEPWDGHPEYEFRDSTYSARGVVVYHGWLPIYSIAAAQALFGMRPDLPVSPPHVLHGIGQIDSRTDIPRLPALLFSLLCMIMIYRLGTGLGGPAAGLGALALTAFNARTVDFGFQARYYSMTLLMNAVAAWFLYRVLTRGRWRDFIGLGISAAFLFHTHLFSTVVFAVVALAATPWIMRREGWLLKSLCGAAVAALLVVPWILLTGFMDNASSVPKIFKVIESPSEALQYLTDRASLLALLVLLVGLVFAARLGGLRLPRPTGEAFRQHVPAYLLLVVWMVVAYAAFHLIVPAASFFHERLSLSLWTPFVLLLGLFMADILRPLSPRIALPLAIVALTAFLGIRGRLAFLEETSIGQQRQGIAWVMSTLQSMDFSPDTRFYATPNEHLTYSYYTGLPVQSVAPVRRSFFETYPGTVVFIESQMDAFLPFERDLQALFKETRREYTSEAEWAAMEHVWRWNVSRDLRRRNIPHREPEPLPDWLIPADKKSMRDYLTWRQDYFEGSAKSPVLRDIPAESVRDLWLGFFYRFVNPADRIGNQLNILPRLRNAEILFLPVPRVLLYISPPLSGEEASVGSSQTRTCRMHGALQNVAKIAQESGFQQFHPAPPVVGRSTHRTLHHQSTHSVPQIRTSLDS